MISPSSLLPPTLASWRLGVHPSLNVSRAPAAENLPRPCSRAGILVQWGSGQDVAEASATHWETAGMSMDQFFTVQQVEKYTVVEFQTASLMNPTDLERIGAALYRLV